MIGTGDIFRADLNDEQRRLVVVVSTTQFHRFSDRVIVVPDIGGPFNADDYPWRVPFGESVFAVDFVRGIPAQRLLDRVDQLDAATLNTIRSALRQLTT